MKDEIRAQKLKHLILDISEYGIPSQRKTVSYLNDILKQVRNMSSNLTFAEQNGEIVVVYSRGGSG